MRALFSIILRTLAWLVWLPAMGYAMLQVVGGNFEISLLFILLVAAVITAPLAHYGQKLKYPPEPRQKLSTLPPAPIPAETLPELPQTPKGRVAAVPPFASGLQARMQPARSSIPHQLRDYIRQGAEEIDSSNE